MKRILAVSALVATAILTAPAIALPLPTVLGSTVADSIGAVASKVHHKPGHIGGRGKHKGWFKPNRGKHKGWRRWR